METLRRSFVAVILFAAVSFPAASQANREDAYRANNLGVAMLEQYKYKEAAEAFNRALKIDPKLALARINLAIALYNLPDVEGALREAKAAVDLLPDAPQAHYMLGLIARSQNRADDAVRSFQRVLQIDPRDVGANVNLGQVYLQQRKYNEAITVFRAAASVEPYNVTATYNLAIALLRGGQREEGQKQMARFQLLRDSNYGTVIGQNYLEEGQYAEAIASTGAEPDLVDATTPEVTFADATSTLIPGADAARPVSAGAQPAFFGRTFKAAELTEAARRDLVASGGGRVTLFDYDGDGDLDLLEATSAPRLYRNDGGRLTDVSASAGLSASTRGVRVGAVAGDYDNDGRADIFLFGYGAVSLYHNDGKGKFIDVTASAAIPEYAYLSLAAAFVDVDHDGDLDIFIAGFVDLAKAPATDPNRTLTFPDDFPPAPNVLLRNNGNGKFADVTAETRLAGPSGRAVALVPTDYDNRRDIDLLLVNYADPPALFSNLRDGTFRNVAAEVGLGKDALAGRFYSVAAGDVNKDNYTDLFFGMSGAAGFFAVSDGKGRFVTTAAPAGTESVTGAQFLDYDNDGLLDLIAVSNGGLRVLRNLGGKWADATGPARARELFQSASSFSSADIDGDGDTDLVASLPGGQLKAARNEGGNRNRSIRVQLVGKVSNRSGVGTKIEARAGSLSQKLETYAASPAVAPADLVFGLGKRATVDAVRLLWPAGNVQSEVEFAGQAGSTKTALSMVVNEVDRKPSSCPYLYAWDGSGFQFITDFMGGGEMGYWVAPGLRNHPDPDEYVRIREDQLKPRNGRYELRVTNELEEALFVDRLQLVSVAHPADTEVYPNEGLIDPPRPPFKLFLTRNARAPASAVDDHGCDVTARIARLDRTYPDDFRLNKIRGYAEQHSLTLDLGADEHARSVLLLTGWTDYAFSSDNVAAHQSKLAMMPPALQVKDRQGRWQTVISDIGIPVGRPQTIAVDLTRRFLSDSREVRIITNMRIYWDQILVGDSAGEAATRIERLDALTADLRWRGFSARATPDGREPFSYDFDRVSFTSPWKVMAGRYTREGDVRGLVDAADDMFVISRPGDEIALSFDATRLAPLPPGWKRTFLLYSDGYSKEMDINSASPYRVEPLPFHAMSGYPYPASESYPRTPRHRRYIETYNTRVVTAPLPAIETVFADVFSLSKPVTRGLQ